MVSCPKWGESVEKTEDPWLLSKPPSAEKDRQGGFFCPTFHFHYKFNVKVMTFPAAPGKGAIILMSTIKRICSLQQNDSTMRHHDLYRQNAATLLAYHNTGDDDTKNIYKNTTNIWSVQVLTCCIQNLFFKNKL